MSTYKKEVGTAVQNAAGTLSGVVEGQLWYDSTAASFKYQYPNVTSAGAWATGNNLNTARTYIESGGTSTAAIGFGGSNPGGYLGNTESYDGTSWTEVNDMNTGRQGEGSGTQTSALAYLGYNGSNVVLTESWNGTNWTEVADANTARRYGASVGADNTNALAFGG